MTPLLEILSALYASEINFGLSSFWDGGIEAWLGDEMNGHDAAEWFYPGDPERAREIGYRPLEELPTWLTLRACELYPESGFAIARRGRELTYLPDGDGGYDR